MMFSGRADTAPVGPAELIDPTARPTLYRIFDPDATTPPELDVDTLLSYGVDRVLDGVAVRRHSVTE